MSSRPGIKSGVINREIDFRAFIGSLVHRPFAISPPTEFENSFIMSVANEDLRLNVAFATRGSRVQIPSSPPGIPEK